MNALAQMIVDRLSARMVERVEKYSAASLKRDVKAAASETDTSPTDAQKEAGNYRKGRFSWNGLSIVIENPAGSVRSGKSKSGHEWSITMPIHYGYIARTESEADGDAIDVFVGPHPESDIVFVVDQQRGDGGQFDEHKVIIGYFTSQAAKDAYQSCYSSGWKGLKSLTPMTVDQFKAWLDEGSSEHPIAGQVSKYAKRGPLAGQRQIAWKEEDHPRDQVGKFMTAGQAASAGKSHGEWTSPIQDAFVNEKIDDDHPAWRSIQNGIAPTIDEYNDAKAVMGQHVRSMHGGVMGKVTSISDDAKSVTVTHANGETSIHRPDTLHHLGADVTRRLQSAGHLSIDQHAEYLGQALAKEAIENNENIGVTMKRHGISSTATAIRAAIARNVDRMKAEPAKYAKNRVASGQLGFGFKEDTGQKSFKWREELHPRDAEGKFTTEENKGQKVEDPENQAQVEKPEAEAQPEELNQSNYAAKMAEKAKEKLAAGGKLVHATHTSFSEYTDPSQIKESGGQLLVMQRGKWVGIPVMNTGMLAKQLDMPNYIDTPPTAEKQAEMDRMAEEAEKQSIESDRQAEEYEGFVNTHFGGSFANASTAREAAGFSDDQNAEWMKSVEDAKRPAATEEAQPEEPEATKSPEEETPKPTPRKKKVSTEVSDFGDKIEVRKDAARANGPRRARKEDDRPGWARRYEVRQAATSTNKNEVGKWFLYDTKIKDRWGNDKEHGMFDTKEEAEAAIPQVEVNRNHRVFRISDGEWADPAAGKEWLAQMNAHYANPDGVPKPEGERPEKIGEEFAISRVVGDRKRPVVVGGFKTREEASEYMKNNPEEIIEHKFPRYETYAFLDHVERQGPKVRDGNVSVKKDNNDFQKTFNFRGGVFGNWQTNKDGQTSLNHAYDALHDLTSAIGLPPKAAALDGTLAIGFGADGTGGVNSARAHFDPDKNLINLTKMSGAGSLAHEWAHALDWYIGGGNNDLSNPKYNTKMRPEVAAAAKELRNAMNSKNIEEEVKAPETSHDVDEVAQTRKNYPNVPEDQLRVVSPATVGGHLHNLTQGIKEYRAYKAKSNKKMAGEIPADQMKQWNDLTAKIASGDVGEKKYVGMRKTYENVEKLNALHKTLTGRSFHTGDWTNPSVGHRLVGRIDDRLSKQERVREAAQGKKETRRVQSDFMKSASKLDDTRGQDYYSTPHEMFARAFEAYVADKLKGKDIRSDYLVSHKKTENHAYAKFGMSPFPEGEERQRINSAFDNLFATLKQESRSDEKGDHVKLYSMRRHDDRMVYALSPAERIASRITELLSQPVRYRNEGERWITIGGGPKGEDGKRKPHGFPVKIDGDGKILAGRIRGLIGKHLSDVKNHFDEQRSTEDSHDHARRSARAHGAKPSEVRKLMPQAHQFLKEQVALREAARTHARNLSKLNSGVIAKIENAHRDWSTVDGFDSVARDVALAHPELGFDPDDTDTPGKVWDLIREGKEAVPARDSREVAELAAQWAKHSGTTKAKEVHPEDALEFSRSRHGESPDKYAFREEDHPRNKIGEFTDGASGGGQSQPAKPGQPPHHKAAASVSAGVAKMFSSTQPERKQQITQAAVKARTANVDRRGERYGNLGTIIGVSPRGTLIVAYDSATAKDGKAGSAGTFEEQAARFDKRFKLGQFAKKPKATKAKPPEKYSFNEQDHPRDESGQFTEKDGDDLGRVKMRQAKAGGEVSEVDGKFYKGGHWLPVHGKYSGQEKPAKKPQQEGESGPVFASEISKGPVMARQLSPEQVEEYRARDRDQREWSRIQAGPLGQLLRLGDRLHHIRGTYGDIHKWAEMFESGEITTDGLEDVEQFSRDQLRQIEDKKHPDMTAEDWQYYASTVDDQAEVDRTNYAPRNIKKLLNAHPAITNARRWISELIEARQDIDTLKEINDRLTGQEVRLLKKSTNMH